MFCVLNQCVVGLVFAICGRLTDSRLRVSIDRVPTESCPNSPTFDGMGVLWWRLHFARITMILVVLYRSLDEKASRWENYVSTTILFYWQN
mmetsp:Transcript_20612/g.33172  ORF Transcript_20612/g.33172 Transcript_20612/m.33172 type:complete len:91 (+) Transcript_20612:188-460(+)